MSESATQVLQNALALPVQERAELVDKLLASFHASSDPRLDELWVREAEDRLDAYDRGELDAIPAEEVFEKINRQRKK
jgi:putative addiction module component (TIGR02574 family)